MKSTVLSQNFLVDELTLLIIDGLLGLAAVLDFDHGESLNWGNVDPDLPNCLLSRTVEVDDSLEANMFHQPLLSCAQAIDWLAAISKSAKARSRRFTMITPLIFKNVIESTRGW